MQLGNKKQKKKRPPEKAGPVEFLVGDDARPDTKPLRVRVVQDNYGVSVEPLNDRGQPMAHLMLDYSDNRLQALVAVGWDKHPGNAILITADTDKERLRDQSEDG
jgi:hypothetical protein